MNETAQDLAKERILLWQDFTQPNGYRDTLTLIKYDQDKWSYEFNVGGTVQVVPYRHFWKIIE
jgi:hypothetical protein